MPNSSRPLSAYEDMRRQLANARGAVTTGFVRCPLCNTKATSQKRFSLGRGLRMHFASVHPDAGDPSPWLDEAEKLAAEGQVSSKRGDEHHKGTKPSAPPGILAARDGDLEELQRLHETGGWGPQDKDATGSLAVHWAAGSGHLRVVRWIVEELGARAAVVPSGKIRKRDGRQPVHWAARNNQVRVLRYLLSQTLVDSAGEAVKVQVDARSPSSLPPSYLPHLSPRSLLSSPSSSFLHVICSAVPTV